MVIRSIGHLSMFVWAFASCFSFLFLCVFPCLFVCFSRRFTSCVFEFDLSGTTVQSSSVTREGVLLCPSLLVLSSFSILESARKVWGPGVTIELADDLAPRSFVSLPCFFLSFFVSNLG